MAIDTKTTAGGVVILFLSGTGGYLATSASKGETNNLSEPRTNLTPVEEKDYSEEMKKKITDNKFESAFDEEGCSESLNKQINDESYKNAIKICFKKLTLKKRAEKLGIELLETKGQSNSTELKTRFDTFGNEEVHKLAKSSVASITWNATKPVEDSKNISNLKEFCTKVEALTLETIFSKKENQSLEAEWTNFLKICAKTENTVKDFWIINTSGN